MPRTCCFIEQKTDPWLLRAGWWGEMGKALTTVRRGLPLVRDRNILKLDGDGGCMIL